MLQGMSHDKHNMLWILSGDALDLCAHTLRSMRSVESSRNVTFTVETAPIKTWLVLWIVFSVSTSPHIPFL